MNYLKLTFVSSLILLLTVAITTYNKSQAWNKSQNYSSHESIAEIQKVHAKELSFLTLDEQNKLCANKWHDNLCFDLIAQ